MSSDESSGHVLNMSLQKRALILSFCNKLLQTHTANIESCTKDYEDYLSLITSMLLFKEIVINKFKREDITAEAQLLVLEGLAKQMAKQLTEPDKDLN